MPLLAKLVDDSTNETSCYGSMYAIAQTAVCLAYGLGPLLGGHLAARFGFPELMSAVGVGNVLYAPLLLLLAKNCQDEEKVILILLLLLL